MKIIDALKDHYLRITNFRKWMIWDDTDKEWQVYELKRNHSVGTLIISTPDEETAIEYLLK
jgi:hypothetical protein